MESVGLAQQEVHLAEEWAARSAATAPAAQPAAPGAGPRALAKMRAGDARMAGAAARRRVEGAYVTGGMAWRESVGTAYWKARLVTQEEDGRRRMKAGQGPVKTTRAPALRPPSSRDLSPEWFEVPVR